MTKYRFDKFDFPESSLRSCQIFAPVLVRFDCNDANYLGEAASLDAGREKSPANELNSFAGDGISSVR